MAVSLRPLKILCWGRETELEHLSGRVFDRDRSITLIHGESGIGKTTIIEELCARLTAPNTLLGRYECSTGADPLLRSLQSLLRASFSDWDQVGDSFALALERGKKNIRSPDRLRSFALAVGKQALELPVFKEYAKVVTGVLGELSDIAGLGYKDLEELVTKVEPEVFLDYALLLQNAFPDRKQVYVIDNLSVDAERSSLSTGVGALDSVLGFLQTGCGRMDRIHMVLTWKNNPETEKAFNRLSSEVREFRSGEVFELKPLEDAMPWLEHDFAWFRGLDATSRKRVLSISQGLPMVIRWWNDTEITSPDFSRLEELAKQAMESRYESLGQELDDSPLPERQLLYQCAIAPRFPTVAELNEITGNPHQDVYDVLRRWQKHGVFKSNPASSSVREFEFEHERKQVYVNGHLEDGLHEKSRKELARQLYDYYLAKVGLPDSEHADAHLFVWYAFTISDRAGVTESEREVLNVLSIRSFIERDLEPLKHLSLAVLRKFPWNTRFLALDLATRTRPWAHWVPEVLVGVIGDEGRLKSSPPNFAARLANLVLSAAKAGELKQVDRLLSELRALRVRHPEQDEIALRLAQALYNAALAYQIGGELERMDELVAELRAVRLQHLGEAEIVLELGKALSNSAVRYGDSGELKRMDELVAELRALRTEYPGQPQIAVRLAQGLYNAALHHAKAGALERVDQLVAELRDLRTQYPEQAEMVLRLAEMLNSAVISYGAAGQLKQVDLFVVESRMLRARYPEQAAIALEFAKALYNAAVAYRNANKLKQMDDLVAELRALRMEYPAQAEIAVELANALYNAAAHYGTARELQGVDQLVMELQALVTQYPGQAEIVLQFAKALYNAAAEYGEAGELQRMYQFTGELRMLCSQHPEQGEIAPRLATALQNAAAHYGTAGELERVDQLVAELQTLLTQCPEQSVIAVRLAHALDNAASDYGKAGDIEQVQRTIAELWKLCAQYPDNAEIAKILSRLEHRSE